MYYYIPNEYIPDQKTKPLTWRQRLLSWPWRPWQSQSKPYINTTGYVSDGYIYVSWACYTKLLEQWEIEHGQGRKDRPN